MRYADHLHRECVAGSSAQHVAGHPVRALASWVARWVAKQRERRLMHHKLSGLEGRYDRHTCFDERKDALEKRALSMVACQVQGNVVPIAAATVAAH